MPPKAKTSTVKTVTTKTTKRKPRTSKSKHKKGSKRVRRRGKRRMRASGLVGQYSKCLSAPFIYPPVRAGYDTFIPTGMATAYIRGTFTMSAGGNLLLLATPNISNLLMTASAATDATSLAGSWAVVGAQNKNAINSQFDMLRVLAGGIRVHPLVAATDKPGIMQSGLMPKCTLGELQNFFPNTSCNAVAGLPFLQTHAKTATVDGIEIAWRPQDNSDFEMKEFDSGWATAPAGVLTLASNFTTDTQSPMLVCDLTGFASGTKVYVEVIFHYEATTSVGTLSTVTQDSTQQTLADQTSIPNFQSVYRSVASSLPPLTTVLTGLAGYATVGVARAAHGNFQPNGNAVWLPD